MNANFRLILAALIFISLTNNILGQSKKALDLQAIKSMAGCYDIEFKYTETFAPEVDYEFAYDYTSAAFEWAEIVEETKDKVVIQHLLIIQRDSMPAYIIKHWRQDWEYQSDREFTYDTDNKWMFSNLDKKSTKGKWTQSVYQVDDSPRYSGTATWTHVDGVSSWYHKADSPLPRREYSKRSDYNLMKRGNRVQITDYGWLHEQDNDKIIRENGEEVLLVQEKGYNTYKKRPDAECEAATQWWAENQNMWMDVRDAWDVQYQNAVELKLEKKVEDKMLYEHLFYSGKTWNKEEIEALIDRYVVQN